MNTRLPVAALVAALSCPAFAADAKAPPAAMPMDPGMPMDRGMHKGMQDMHKGMGDMQGMSMHNPDQLQWSDAPPALPKGAKVAVLDGDPFKPGPYVIRLKMPPGYKVPPHWHSKAENVTVIMGMLSLGMGDTLDEKKADTLRPGGFHAIGAQVHHYAYSKGGAIVQIHGEGPFDITYINPADDPSGKR